MFFISELTAFQRNLFLTSPMLRGGDVLAVQRALVLKQNASLAQDGIFGASTAAAVSSFQTASSLSKDGIVGRATWAALLGQPVTAVSTTLPQGAKDCYNALKAFGWGDPQCWGIVANVKHESDFNPAATGDGGLAYGLCQWHPDRQAAFGKVYPNRSIFGSLLKEQCALINYELTPPGSEAAAGSRLRAAGSAAEAGEIVNRYYERPAAVEAEAAARGQTAEYYASLAAAPGAITAPRPAAPATTAPDRETFDVMAPRALQYLQSPHVLFPGATHWQLSQKDGIVINGQQSPPDQTDSVAQLLSKYTFALSSLLTQIRVPVELVLALLDLFASSAGPTYLLGCDLKLPERTPDRVTNGVLQAQLALARVALRRPDLNVTDLDEPEIGLSAGVKILWMQAGETYFDPPLVAAAYATGGLFYDPISENGWRLSQQRPGFANFIDSFVKSFSAATWVVAASSLPAGIPSLLNLQTTMI